MDMLIPCKIEMILQDITYMRGLLRCSFNYDGQSEGLRNWMNNRYSSPRYYFTNRHILFTATGGTEAILPTNLFLILKPVREVKKESLSPSSAAWQLSAQSPSSQPMKHKPAQAATQATPTVNANAAHHAFIASISAPTKKIKHVIAGRAKIAHIHL